MADPADAAAAAANDEDVDDLYADLDDQVAAALAAAVESGGSNTKDSDAEADANEAVDLGDGFPGCSSSDEESEDDIRIVLNEGGCARSPPSAVRCEEWAEESEDAEVRGSLVKGSYVNDGGRSKGLLDKETVPIPGQGDRGHQNAFQKDYYFFLPRNRTVFDRNTEVFQQKPWRQHGADLTDYFNFGLNEEGWRKYCFGMKQFRQGDTAVADESSRLDQEPNYNLESIELISKSATYSAFDGTQGSDNLAKPKGRAIDVESGVFERLPSADMWRPKQRDSDVVIQVKLMLSPSNHSTSDDRSTLNGKGMINERISFNKPGAKCLKDTGLVVNRVGYKEVHSGDSSDCSRSKLDIRDSAGPRDHSSSSDYCDMLSEDLTEDCYFKRANRHSNSKDLHADNNLKNRRAKSNFCRHSSKSDQESSKSDSHGYTSWSADDRYHKKTKLLRTDEPDFTSNGLFINRRSDRRFLKSGHIGIKEQKESSAGARQDMFKKQEKIRDSYTSRYARRHDHRNVFHDQVYEKHYSPLERAFSRNDVQCFSNDSNHQRRLSWHELNDDEDGVQCFSSASRWQQRRDHSETDGRIYRESYYQETRNVRHGYSEDNEILHYRGKYRNRISAESNDEHLRHPYHIVLSPQANSERDWPSHGLTSLRSRNRYVDTKRTQNPKMTKYHPDGYYQNSKNYGLSFRIGNIQQSDLYTADDETGNCIMPAKRRLHTNQGSMNHKDLVRLSFPKARKLTHPQSMISDRKLYAEEAHSSPKEFDRDAIRSFIDMRNSDTISKFYDETRHEHMNFSARDVDSSHLSGRKRKFKQQGNEIRPEVESDTEGCLPAVKDLRNCKNKEYQKARKLNRSYCQSFDPDLDRSTKPKCKDVVSTNEGDEIEEGELIEQDHQDTVSKNKLNKQRGAVLKSVIEVCAAGQLEVINAAPKDDVSDRATRKFDDKHILEVMEKMQKRRERFKEPVITQKEEDCVNKELLTASCSKDGIKNQRPARRRRWGGSG